MARRRVMQPVNTIYGEWIWAASARALLSLASPPAFNLGFSSYACMTESPHWRYSGDVDAQNKLLGKIWRTGIAHAAGGTLNGVPKVPTPFEGKVLEHAFPGDMIIKYESSRKQFAYLVVQAARLARQGRNGRVSIRPFSHLSSGDGKLGPRQRKLLEGAARGIHPSIALLAAALALDCDCPLLVRRLRMASLAIANINAYGGIGGAGGAGGQSGGLGGAGQGAQISFASAEHVHVYNTDRDGEREKILKWIAPINFFATHDALSISRQENTGGWFLDHPTFKEWENSSGKILWCYGIPGAGKTMLLSKAVDHLAEKAADDPTIGVAFLYLNYLEAGDQTLQNLLAALWQQLSIDEDIEDATAVYESHKAKKTLPSLKEVQDLLAFRVQKFIKVYVAVDGLDEFSGSQEQLISSILDLGPQIALMITCRPHVSFKVHAEKALKLEIIASHEDIKVYTIAQIQASGNLKTLVEGNPTLQQDIISNVTQKTRGMFLVANLQMQILSNSMTSQDIQHSLDDLPQSVGTSYQQIIDKIQGMHTQSNSLSLSRVFTALAWITNARRPLTVLEVQTVLAFAEDANCLHPTDATQIKMHTLLDACCGLLVQSEGSDTLQLVHYTAQPFLQVLDKPQFQEAPVAITRQLLLYLKLVREKCIPSIVSSLETEKLFSEKKLYNLVTEKAPLADYCQYFLLHAKGTPEIELHDELLQQLYAWQFPTWSGGPWGWTERVPNPSPLWMAVAGNLVQLVETMLPAMDSDQNSEIIIAAKYGYLSMVELFTTRWIASDQLIAALHAACRSQNPQIVKLFLEKTSVNYNTMVDQEWTALHIAAYHGNTEIVQLLLQSRADQKQRNNKGQTAVYMAASQGHIDVVKLLTEDRLREGSDLVDLDGLSPLHAAASAGHATIVQHLLDHIAPNLFCYFSGAQSPLNLAAQNGHEEVVQLLLKLAPEQIEQKDKNGQAALHAAARGAQPHIIKLLLGTGANCSEADYNGYTPLHLAAEQDQLESIKLLLAAGCDYETKTYDSQTVLHLAAQHGQEEIVRFFINAGVDPKAKNFAGDTPLHLVANTNSKIVKQLLDAGVDYNSADEAGDTPMHFAAAQGNDNVVTLLMKSGADIYARNGKDQTTLIKGVLGGHEHVVQLLLGAGFNTKATDCQEALNLAFELEHTKLVQLLLEAGANDNELLYSAAVRGYSQIVALLIAQGVDANSKSSNGDTALFLAAREGHVEVVKLLLEPGTQEKSSAIMALHVSSSQGHIDVVKALIDAGVNKDELGNEDKTPLHQAASHGHLAIVKLLLAAGADTDLQDEEDETAMHKAAFKGHTEITKLLISADADVNLKNDDDETAMHLAALEGHADIVKLLIAAGAHKNTTCKERYGQTAMHIAAAEGHTNVVKQLITSGARKNAEDKDGETPMHLAARKGHSKVVQLLIDANANQDQTNNSDQTPMHLATRHDHAKIVRLLIKSNADENIPDKDGRTALHHAAIKDYAEIAKLLINAGANKNIQDKDGKTALHIAAKEGNEEIVSLLLDAGAGRRLKDKRGNTALDIATKNHHRHIAQLLRT
uniref:Ankyrin 2,3/unc44 n=1 Tax=Mycena chlorophos TaxID=658473 RepID=A0ABQ0L145_MYCCL|nr:ankyrin 2,3/unc44 [Mycena chlorophos]